MVSNIRITAFPSNANTITINGVIYINGGSCPSSCTPWPGGGVVVPYTNGVGVSQPILVDPVDGTFNVVIPFVSVDNAGAEDLTPGSVTIPYFSILPVQLVSFTGTAVRNTASLNWKTASEQSLDRFEVEWSSTGSNWQLINSVAARGGITGSAEHGVQHLLASGVNYFRLKMVDVDGRFTYSNILRMKLGEQQDVLVSPNPATNVITLSLPTADKSKISIFSVAGTEM